VRADFANGVAIYTRPVTEAATTPMVWPLATGAVRSPSASAPPSVVGVADLRGNNAAAVLAAIRSADLPQRVANLVEKTKLSRPTVEHIVEDLVRVGLIDGSSAPASSGAAPGRPARLFRFRPDAGYVVGVDVRAYSVAACVADIDGTVVALERMPVRRDLTGAARAKAVVATVQAALKRGRIGRARVCAATVGTPGWVEDNVRVRYVDNLKDWASVDIAATLGDILGCAVAVDNDANLAALGEQERGAAAGVRDLVFILLGERLGAGIIAGGRPLHGQHGAAGEIGFMVFPDGSPLAARAIGEQGAQRPGINPASVYADAEVVKGATAGDPAAVGALRRVGERLAEAMAPLLLALDPAVVVLGTSLFALPDLEAARAIVLGSAAERAAELLVDPPDWRLSALGDDAILTGAACFALSAVEHVLQTRPASLFA
jgi:predicted NBD/HSP70 family sugar kinase